MSFAPTLLDSRDRPLRIAIVTENFLPKVDGVTRTLSRLLKHLREQGHEAILLGPRSEMEEYEGAAIVGTRGIPLPSYKGLFLNFMRPLFIRRLLYFKPDIVHFVDPIWLGAQSLPAVEHFMPEAGLVSSFHTNTARYASLYGWPWLESAMWSIQRYLHGRCSVTFCPSPSTARALQDKGFENVRIWSRGADTVLFNPKRRDPVLRAQWAQGIVPPALSDPVQLQPPSQTDSDELVLVYVGRLAWEKNIKLLIEAFVGLQESLSAQAGQPKAVRLILVGDGPARPELEKHCETHNLDNVLFMGHREGVDLARCYASADIFAFPSWTETFGQVVLEALSSGLPVVGLVAEGIRDLVNPNETGLLLDVHTLGDSTAEPRTACDPSGPLFPAAVSAYRGLLVKLLLDDSRRRLMSQAAFAEASKHSWFEEMERLVDGYRDVRELAAWRRERKMEKLASLRSVPDLTLHRTASIASDATISEINTPVASPALAPVRSIGSVKNKPFSELSGLRRVIGVPRRRRSAAPSTGTISPLTSPLLIPVHHSAADNSIDSTLQLDCDDEIEDMVLSSEREWRRSTAIKASLLGRSVVVFWLVASIANVLYTQLL